jgi:uncharacterized protein (TIGR00369 family)
MAIDLQAVSAVMLGLPHFKALGLEVVEAAPGIGAMRLPYHPRYLGDPDTGVIHGGVISTLGDSAAGLAVMLSVPRETPIATLDLRVDHLRPAAAGHDLWARAECYAQTRSVAFVRVGVHQGEPARPVAQMAASFMVGSVGFAV